MSLAKACGRVLKVNDDSLNCCGKKPPGFEVTLEVPPQNSNFEFEGNENGKTVQTTHLVYDDGTEESVQVIHSTRDEDREVIRAKEYVTNIEGGSIESHTISEEGTHAAQDMDHLHMSNGIIKSGPSKPNQTQRHGSRKRFHLPSGSRFGAVGPWGPNASFRKFQQRMGLFTPYKTRGRHRSRSVGHRSRSRSQISDPVPIIASTRNFSSNTKEANMNLSPTSLPTCEVGTIDTRVRANEVDMDSVGASKQGETTPHSAKDCAMVVGNLYRCRSEEEVRDWIQYMVIPLAGTLGISFSLGTAGLEKLFWELLGTKSTNEDVMGETHIYGASTSASKNTKGPSIGVSEVLPKGYEKVYMHASLWMRTVIMLVAGDLLKEGLNIISELWRELY
ncbi:hypothetical protein IFM89_014715 [Coptis chinensis]|uniref:Uncharacterized protein n=1 Tax=Coptis chinensis TaxID=261450 RepID=A0A835HBS9_9MAGN|nr:hypothetical protein IFM89_014715 [Coptis chinensis]